VADRSHSRTASAHYSHALSEVLTHWGMLDPVALHRPRVWDGDSLALHRQATHTYFYSINGMGPASSRLDRWYLGSALERAAHVETVEAGARSDHKGAKIHFISPTDPVRIRKSARIFPVPAYVAEAVRHITRKLIQDLADQLEKGEHTPARWAEMWDDFKLAVMKATLRVKKERRKAMRGGLQQKLKRLLKQQQRHLEEDRGLTASVATITDLLAALSLDDVGGPDRAARLRRAISDCKRELAALHQRRLFNKGGHWNEKNNQSTVQTGFGQMSGQYCQKARSGRRSACTDSAR